MISTMIFLPASIVDDIPVLCQLFLLATLLHDSVRDAYVGVSLRLEQSFRRMQKVRDARHRAALANLPCRADHDIISSSSRTKQHHTTTTTTTTTTNTFNLFSSLPAEIRDLIWTLAIDTPTERLFHVERLRPVSNDPAITNWRFYQRSNLSILSPTLSHNIPAHDNSDDGATSRAARLTQSLTASAVGATCREARAVLCRTRHLRQHARSGTSTPPLGSSLVATADDSAVPSRAPFNPTRDILYIDSACLGPLPTVSVARSRVKALSGPALARDVEVVGIEMHCVLAPQTPAASPGTWTTEEQVKRAVLEALCEGFPKMRKLVLLTSRQHLPRRKGFAELLGLTTTTTTTAATESSDPDCDSGETPRAISWKTAVCTPLLMLATGLDALIPSRGDKTALTAQEASEEHECCKTLAACLVSPSDLEIPPTRSSSSGAAGSGGGRTDSGDGDDGFCYDMATATDRVGRVLAALAREGGTRRAAPPVVVESRVIVRAGGCTGPWTYRARITRGSCSNDEWFWARRGMGLPVWKVRDEVLGKLEFS